MATPDSHAQPTPAASDQQTEQRVLSPFGGLVAKSLLEPVLPSRLAQESAQTGIYVLNRFRPDESNNPNYNSQSAAEAGGAAPAARPPCRDALGLSTSHIRPQNYRRDLWQVRAYKGGSVVEIHSPGVVPSRKGGGKRGIIKRFSESSRRRLLRALSRVLQSVLPVFVTLTYPDNFPGDPRVWKSHLKAWLKRLKRQHPHVAGFWKLELKHRRSGTNAGEIAPHFHLLLWGLPESWLAPDGYRQHWEYQLQQEGWCTPAMRFWKREEWCDGELTSTSECVMPAAEKALPVEMFMTERVNRRGQQVRVVEHWLRDGGAKYRRTLNLITSDSGGPYAVELAEWLSLTWEAVVESGDPRHVRAGTRVEAIRSQKGVMYYASKYVCKLDTEVAESSGRFWGIHNAPDIPWAEAITLPLDRQQAVRVMRIARRYIWTQQRQREHPRKIHLRGNCGMTFFCDAAWWLQRLPSIAGG